MNEPAVFDPPTKTMPLDTVHYVEDRKTDHREIHNVFGMQNVRATNDGLLKLQPDVRPFVLTRAAYAGTQRYAATWTGDNPASWNHMRLSLSQLMGLGVSGYSFVGDDIGGFNGSPTPELLTRWMELGAFNPIYRNHAARARAIANHGSTAPNTKRSANVTSRRATGCFPTSTRAWKKPAAPASH
jgi:alpha-glucosidase